MIFTNLSLLYDKKIDTIILDVKDGIEACNPRTGKQRIQHHNGSNLGDVMCSLTKIEITQWTEFFQEQVKAILQVKVMLAISVAKINNRTGFKDNSTNEQAPCRSRKKKV